MNESRPQPVLFRLHVKPASAPGERHHAIHVSPEAHIVAVRFAVYLQRAALGPSRPKQMYLPRSSEAAVGYIPSGTTYSTGGRYRALGGGIKLLVTCYGVRPTCLRGGRGRHISPADWNHGFCAR